MKKIVSLVFLSLVLVGAGCASQSTTVQDGNGQTMAVKEGADIDVTAEGENGFDLSNIKVGDKIRNMVVEEMIAYSEAYDMGVTARELSDTDASIKFSGEVTLTGKYLDMSEDVSQGQYCFTPDKGSADKLPKLNSDGRAVRFCFTNKDVAEKLLGSSYGSHVIVIDEYIVNNYPAEVWNTANLKEVVS